MAQSDKSPKVWRLLMGWPSPRTTRPWSWPNRTANASQRSTSLRMEVWRPAGYGLNFSTGVPDGICLDVDGATWYGDVPNKRSVRVREGGEVVQMINLDRGCFACMLGGTDGKTLFMVAAE